MPARKATVKRGGAKSVEFLRDIMERVNDGFAALDKNWNYVYLNSQAAKVVQRTPEELVGKNIWKEFPEAVGSTFYHGYQKAMKTQTPVVITDYYAPLDRWFENRIFPSKDGITFYLTDITDRKRSEKLIEYEAILLDKRNALLEMIARGEKSEMVFAQIIRTIEAEAKGTVCSVLLLSPDGIHVRHTASSASMPIEYMRAIDGSPIGPKAGSCGTAMYTGKPVIVSDIKNDPLWEDYKAVALPHGFMACWSIPIFSPAKKVLGSFAMYYHEVRSPNAIEIKLIEFAARISEIVLERESVDRLLRDREQSLSSIYATVGDVIFQLNIEPGNKFRFASVNRAFLNITGLKEEQVVGRRVDEVVPEPSLSFVLRKYQEAIETKKIVHWEEISEYPSGKLTGEVSIAPVLDAKGNCTHLVGAVHDITERKKNEEALRQLNSELEARVKERTAELAMAMQRAQDADRLKSAFLATMSHELRTPLNSIIGFTGILTQGLAGPLNEEQLKQISMANHSAKHLLALINDVLDISKIEARQLEIRTERFDIRKAIEMVAGVVRPAAAKKNISLKISIAPDVSALNSDHRRVEQILVNLLNNAVKFTDAGQVALDCRVTDGKMAIRVSDTGIGIKPEDLPDLFKPFRQIDTGLARRHEGTGLGLSICKQLTALLGGSIGVESVFGKGSDFTVTLPLGD